VLQGQIVLSVKSQPEFDWYVLILILECKN